MTLREWRRVVTCWRKRRYDTWQDAGDAALAVWRENPREKDANPGMPYRCELIGPPHYHHGHVRLTKKPA